MDRALKSPGIYFSRGLGNLVCICIHCTEVACQSQKHWGSTQWAVPQLELPLPVRGGHVFLPVILSTPLPVYPSVGGKRIESTVINNDSCIALMSLRVAGTDLNWTVCDLTSAVQWQKAFN